MTGSACSLFAYAVAHQISFSQCPCGQTVPSDEQDEGGVLSCCTSFGSFLASAVCHSGPGGADVKPDGAEDPGLGQDAHQL